MPDEPQDTQQDTPARRLPDGTPDRDGLAATPQDTATGALKPQDEPLDRPGAEAEEAAEPMTNEPLPVAEDGPGVGLSPSPDETIDGNRGM